MQYHDSNFKIVDKRILELALYKEDWTAVLEVNIDVSIVVSNKVVKNNNTR